MGNLQLLNEGRVVALDFIERHAVRLLLKTRLAELHGATFESFFQDLMCHGHTDFVDVRTAGSLGDLGSDGLLLHGRTLYACYAPEVFDAGEVKRKFSSDLNKARVKRDGQFSCFSFVHNDLRGMHPVISSVLVEAVQVNPDITFDVMGYRRIRDEVLMLERAQVEDLLGMPLPVQELVYSVTLEELEPLLTHLKENRFRSASLLDIGEVSQEKLDYNAFEADTREDLQRAMVRSADIDRYYAGRIDITERDEVAARFGVEYGRIRDECSDPEEVLWLLEQYILGNASTPWNLRRGAVALIAYFFQTCDIFENPPPGWRSSVPRRGSA